MKHLTPHQPDDGLQVDGGGEHGLNAIGITFLTIFVAAIGLVSANIIQSY